MVNPGSPGCFSCVGSMLVASSGIRWKFSDRATRSSEEGRLTELLKP